MHRSSTVGALAAIAFLLAACGGAADATSSEGDQPAASPSAGMCAQDQPDCVDTIVGDEDVDRDAVDEGAMIRDAESLLGQSEDEVLEQWADVRVGRHGDEAMMLTEDYVIGRKTIATEDDGSGTFRVVEVTLELTDGPVIIVEAS
jgi:hypothetical protein